MLAAYSGCILLQTVITEATCKIDRQTFRSYELQNFQRERIATERAQESYVQRIQETD